MNILWLSHLVPYPPKGGVLQRSYNLLKEVSKYHDVVLVGFVQSDLVRAMFPTVESGLKEASRYLQQICSEVRFVQIPCERTRYGKQILALKSLISRSPYTTKWLESHEMHALLDELRLQRKFDVIHFDTISLSPYIKEFPDYPKVLDHHNIESHMMARRSRQERSLIKRIYFGVEARKLLEYEKHICREFNRHITCSSLDSKRLAEIDSSLQIDEIPNGVDVSYFYPQHENETAGHLVFAGGLSWYPNRDAMIYFAQEIWPLLKEHIPGIVMNVVGKSPPKELIKIAQEDTNYRVHGFVDDVRGYLSNATIYVCPIRDGGGTKLKLLDAFAMGKATVAHPVSCEGLDVTDNVNVMLANTPIEFVNKIKILHNNEELRRSIGNNARELVVEKYAFSGIGKKLSDIYLDLGRLNAY